MNDLMSHFDQNAHMLQEHYGFDLFLHDFAYYLYLLVSGYAMKHRHTLGMPPLDSDPSQ